MMKIPSMKEIYDALAHQIEREDSLVCNRINWFLVSQGFLFAAAGVIITSGTSGIKECSRIIAIKIIAFLGGLIGIIVFVGVIGAEISIWSLRKRWKNMESDYIEFFSPPYGKGLASALGCFPRSFIPIVIVSAWIYIYFNVYKIF
jgi:hypothetical protein